MVLVLLKHQLLMDGKGRAASRVNFIPVDRWAPKKMFPKKQKCKLLTLACLSLSLFSIKLQNTLEPNSFDKLMQLISMKPHIYDLDKGKITDLDKFLKRSYSVVLS